MPASADEQQMLRRKMRSLRSELSADATGRAARALCGHIAALDAFARAERLAAYLAMPGEMDPFPLIELAWQRGKQVFLPAVQARIMRFLPFTMETPLVSGPFGLRQPRAETGADGFDPRGLDLVLLPLVAFDADGGRLGMGGGYYDRTFAFCRERNPPRPVLVGVAYGFQQVERLHSEPWDVPLDLVVTEAGLIDPTRSPRAPARPSP